MQIEIKPGANDGRGEDDEEGGDEARDKDMPRPHEWRRKWTRARSAQPISGKR